MPPKRKHHQQQAETEHKAAPEDQQEKGVKEEEQQEEAKASEEKAKEEEEGVGAKAASSPKEEKDIKEEEEKDAPEVKRRKVSFQEEKEEKKEEEKKNVQEGEVQPFEFAWDKFIGLLEGDGAGFTGAEPYVSVCDEPVDESLVRAGLELLNAATGPWHEDADEGRRRTEQVAASGGDYGDSVVRVYRASSSSTEPHNEPDRYELSFLQCPGFSHFEYVFVVDKAKRRFVFVGEAGSHPQAGTNDFVYDNSDGSGPGLLPDSSVPPTPTTLLDAARQRFSEFCLDHHH